MPPDTTTAGPAAATASPAVAPAPPATTCVTVLTGRRLTDLALPSSAPMETYVDDTVAALADLLEDAPSAGLDGFDFAAQGSWAFARPGAPPLPPGQSLDDAGVVDGTMLMLVPVSRTERYRPLVEDVIDAIAVLDETPQFDRAALHRFAAVTLPVLTVLLTALAAWTWWHTGRGIGWPIALGSLGAIALAGSWFATRMRSATDVSEGLLVSAVILLAATPALSIPPPRGESALGPPQFAAAVAVVMFIALTTRGGPRRRTELAAAIAVLGLAATAAILAGGFGWTHWVPIGAVLFGLFVVTASAKLTIAVARIALPPIPAPGETVTHDELLDPVAGQASPDGESSTWRAIFASVPDSTTRLTERSELAKRLLTGFLVAGATVLAVGGITVVVQGHFFVQSLVVAGLTTVVCAFRSRLFAERWCAWALLAACVAVPVGVIARLSIWYPERAWMLLSGLLAAALLAAAVVAASRGVRRLTPVTRRVLELVDGAAITVIIPMLMWIAGLYDLVRNLRF